MKKGNDSKKVKRENEISSATRFALSSSRIEGIKPSRQLKKKLAGSIKENRKGS